MDRRKIRLLLIGEFSVKRLVRSAALIYIAVFIFAVAWGDSLMFPAPPPSYEDGGQIIKIESDEGVTLSALYLVHPDAQFTVLFNHSNGEDLGHIRPFLEDYVTRGFSVFSYDYRGYGTSQGKPTEHNTYKDVEAGYRYLTQELGVAPSQIIVHGRSLGGGPATYIASIHPVAGLVLESTFVSAFRAVTQVPLFPLDKFKNIARLEDLGCPLLVIHGTKDRVVPFWQGEALFTKAKVPKSHLWVDQGTHYDVSWAAEEAYWEAIEDFVQTVKRHAVTSAS